MRQLPFLLVLAVSVILGQLSLNTGHVWGDDFAGYILQAESLLQGRVWEEESANRRTVEHSGKRMAPVAYPWGTPLLLAPVLALAGLDFLVLKHLNLLCLSLLLLVVWFGMGAAHAPPYRLLLTAMVGLNPALVGSLNEVLSDIPFLLASTLGVVLIGRRLNDDEQGTREGILLGIVLALGVVLRTAGWLLVVALVVGNLAKVAGVSRMNRDRATAALIPIAVFGIIAGLSATFLPGDTANLATLLFDYPEGFVAHLGHYARLPVELFGSGRLTTILYCISIPLAGAGLMHRARTEVHTVTYCVLTVALVLAWPFWPGNARFLLPILPFYFSFLVSGLELVVRNATSSRAHWRRYAVAGFSAVMLLTFTHLAVAGAASNVVSARVAQKPGPTMPTAQELYSFVQSHVAPGLVVASHKPRAMRLFGRRGSYRTDNPSELPVNGYYCHYRSHGDVTQLSEDDVSRMTQSGGLQSVFQNADFELYVVIRRP